MEEREKRASRKEGIQNLVERKKKTLKEGKKERKKKTYRKKKES